MNDHRAEGPARIIVSPAFRRYVYSAVAGIIPVLIVTGTLSDGLAQAIMVAVAGVLGLGTNVLAAANTPNGAGGSPAPSDG